MPNNFRVHLHLQVNSLHLIVQGYRGLCSTYSFLLKLFFGFTFIIVKELLENLDLRRSDEVLVFHNANDLEEYISQLL